MTNVFTKEHEALFVSHRLLISFQDCTPNKLDFQRKQVLEYLHGIGVAWVNGRASLLKTLNEKMFHTIAGFSCTNYNLSYYLDFKTIKKSGIYVFIFDDDTEIYINKEESFYIGL